MAVRIRVDSTMSTQTSHDTRFRQYDYDRLVHTPDRLGLDLSRMCEFNPNVRVAGSLGRAVVYDQIGKGFGFEFDSRDQAVTHRRLNRSRMVARDIDVMGPLDDVSELAFPVDRSAYTSMQAEMVYENDQWWLVGRKHRFAEELEPEVMEAYLGRLGEHSYITIPPATQYAALWVLGSMRSNKIVTTHRQFGQALNDNGINTAGSELTPFYRLGELNRDDFVNRARHTYRMRIPGGVRERLVPISGIVTKRWG